MKYINSKRNRKVQLLRYLLLVFYCLFIFYSVCRKLFVLLQYILWIFVVVVVSYISNYAVITYLFFSCCFFLLFRAYFIWNIRKWCGRTAHDQLAVHNQCILKKKKNMLRSKLNKRTKNQPANKTVDPNWCIQNLKISSFINNALDQFRNYMHCLNESMFCYRKFMNP